MNTASRKDNAFRIHFLSFIVLTPCSVQSSGTTYGCANGKRLLLSIFLFAASRSAPGGYSNLFPNSSYIVTNYKSAVNTYRAESRILYENQGAFSASVSRN